MPIPYRQGRVKPLGARKALDPIPEGRTFTPLIEVALKILVVDDHEAVRRGVCTIVQTLDGVEVCGEAANGLEAIDRARELMPDLIIMDITMPVIDGFKAARLIRDILPQASILLLSMHNGSKLRNIAMSVGADGFVCKDQGVGVLRQAIQAVTHNQTFFP